MKEEKHDTFEFFYDVVGEKELTEQLTDAYQSGFEYHEEDGLKQERNEK